MQDTAIKLRNTIEGFFRAAPGLDAWGYKASPEKWSRKEIIGHLIDSAQINLQRFVRCTYEENFKLIYFQEEWVQAQRYQEADTDQLLQLWRLLNLQIVGVLMNYPEDRVNAQCDNSRNSVSLHTVEYLAQDYVAHLQHHLKQILNYETP
jgi:hypothetical protein